jgi:hypothetical protein
MATMQEPIGVRASVFASIADLRALLPGSLLDKPTVRQATLSSGPSRDAAGGLAARHDGAVIDQEGR